MSEPSPPTALPPTGEGGKDPMRAGGSFLDAAGIMPSSVSADEFSEAARQMWSENINDKENANGIVTPGA